MGVAYDLNDAAQPGPMPHPKRAAAFPGPLLSTVIDRYFSVAHTAPASERLLSSLLPSSLTVGAESSLA